MNLKRIKKRIEEEIFSTVQIAKVLNVRDAISTFRGKVDIQLMVHNGRKEWFWIKKHLLRKHEVMNRYFDKTCSKLSDEKIKKLENNEVKEIKEEVVQETVTDEPETQKVTEDDNYIDF